MIGLSHTLPTQEETKDLVKWIQRTTKHLCPKKADEKKCRCPLWGLRPSREQKAKASRKGKVTAAKKMTILSAVGFEPKQRQKGEK